MVLDLMPGRALSLSVLSVLLVACDSGNEPVDSSGTAPVADSAPAAAPAVGAGPADPLGGVSRDAVAAVLANQFRMPEEEAAAILDSLTVTDVGVDIRGVRLGMTPAEAMQALQADFPDHAIIEVTKYGSVERFKGNFPGPLNAESPGAYPITMSATDNVTKDHVVVDFAKPPAENVVQSISRRQTPQFSEAFQNGEGQIAKDAYRQALIDKYGPPASEFDLYSGKVLKWVYPPDGMDCTGGAGAANPRSWVYQGRDPTQCATTLMYSYGADNAGVVTSAQARIGDPDQLALGQRAYDALITAIREQVNDARRNAATAAPDL